MASPLLTFNLQSAPSTPPTTPYTPLSVRRRASLSHVVSPVRRSPQGVVGAHLPASRAICAPAAALPRCGDRLRAPARWSTGYFPGLCVAWRGALAVPPGHRSDRRRFYLRANIPKGKHHRFPHDVRTIFLPHCVLPAQCTESAGGKPFFLRAGKAAPVEKDSVAKRGFKRKRGRAEAEGRSPQANARQGWLPQRGVRGCRGQGGRL